MQKKKQPIIEAVIRKPSEFNQNSQECIKLKQDLKLNIDEINSKMKQYINVSETDDSSHNKLIENKDTYELNNLSMSEDNEEDIKVTMTSKMQEELKGFNPNDPIYFVSDYSKIEENKMKLEEAIGSEDFYEIYGGLLE